MKMTIRRALATACISALAIVSLAGTSFAELTCTWDASSKTLTATDTDASGTWTVAAVKTAVEATGATLAEVEKLIIDAPKVKGTLAAAATAACAFTGLSSLGEITVVNATEISGGAFKNQKSVTKISLPTTVTDIPQNAFQNASKLIEADMPGALKLGNTAFSGCSELTTINAPKLQSLGTSAFMNCKKLEALDLPEVAVVGATAFRGCTALKRVNIPKVTTLGGAATKNGNLMSQLFAAAEIGEMNYPDLKVIGDAAFANLAKMTGVLDMNVTMPSVKEVGSYVFYGTGLSEVIFPDGIEKLFNAFSSCTNIERVVIPNTIKQFSVARAFSGCTSLVAVRLPDIDMSSSAVNLDEMDYMRETFKGATALREIVIPADYTKKMKVLNAFNGCSSLRSATFMGDVTLTSGAFASCKSLEEVTIMGDLREISAASVFSGADGFTLSILGTTLPTNIDAGAFTGASNITVALPDGADVDAWKDALGDSAKTAVTKWITSRTIDAPQLESKTTRSVTLKPIPRPAGGGDVMYGCSIEDSASSVASWQMSTTFFDLNGETAYYFFAKVIGSDGSAEYQDVTSRSALIVTGDKKPCSVPAPRVVEYTNTYAIVGDIQDQFPDSLVQYGSSTENSVASVKDWSGVPRFDDLTEGTTYWFFASVTDSPEYADSWSSASQPFVPTMVGCYTSKIIEGGTAEEWTEGDHVVHIDADFELFESVVNESGIELRKDVDYDVTWGSTIVTLYDEFIASLPEGEHKFTVRYSDDGTADFVIKKGTDTQGETGGSKSSSSGGCAAGSGLAAITALAALAMRKRRDQI